MIRKKHIRVHWRTHDTDRVVATTELKLESETVFTCEEYLTDRQAAEERLRQEAMQFIYGALRRELHELQWHVHAVLESKSDPVALGEHFERVLGLLDQ